MKGFTMLGSFAEFLALPRADLNLCLIPPNVSFVEAAALGCRFTTAYRAVVQQGRLDTKKGNEANRMSVGVFGCGGLGLSCIMIAAAGYKHNSCRKRQRATTSDGTHERKRCGFNN
jgi:alcohol dehydrogenase